MKSIVTAFVSTVLLASSAQALAAEGAISKQQAMDKALKTHPGTVVKAYKERKRGVQAWEVQVKDKDGQVWAMYYAVDGGRLITAGPAGAN